ncbi:hypothetical protein BDV18DRAFT_133118 [Aspergillus unguis]
MDSHLNSDCACSKLIEIDYPFNFRGRVVSGSRTSTSLSVAGILGGWCIFVGMSLAGDADQYGVPLKSTTSPYRV